MLIIKIIILLFNLINIILTTNDVQKDGYICLSCPLVPENDENNDKIVSYWQIFQNNGKNIALCDRQKDIKRINNLPIYGSINFSCKKNQLCLSQFKKTYPTNFVCAYADGIANVDVNYYGK
jgi:hypothetical protein